MSVELRSIRLDAVTDDTSNVEIEYLAPNELDGIELMGVDAGLSWIKGESISLRARGEEDESEIYVGYISVEDSCEFRARGFANEEDIWEEGLGNHKLIRAPNGTIQFETYLDDDMYEFRGDLPTIFEPTEEEISERLTSIEKSKPNIFQVLVDLHYWTRDLFDDPLQEEKIHLLSSLQRYLKREARLYNSKKVDDVVRPVIIALYNMYRSAMDFAGDEPRLLAGEWEQKGFQKTLADLHDQVKKLEKQKLGVGKDASERFKNLLEYV